MVWHGSLRLSRPLPRMILDLIGLHVHFVLSLLPLFVVLVPLHVKDLQFCPPLRENPSRAAASIPIEGKLPGRCSTGTSVANRSCT